MFPEHVERSFLDPEYSFDEYFQLGSRRNIRPIKNGLKKRKAKPGPRRPSDVIERVVVGLLEEMGLS